MLQMLSHRFYHGFHLKSLQSICARTFSSSSIFHSRASNGLKKLGVVSCGPLFLCAEKYTGRTAVVDRLGQFTFDDLLHLGTCLSQDFLTLCSGQAGHDGRLDHQRIGFLCENDSSYVVTLFATWMVNGIAVPLCKSHPASEIEYFVYDSQCSLLVASQGLADKIRPVAQKLNIPLRVINDSELTSAYEENQWFASELGAASRRCSKTRTLRPKRWYDLHQASCGFKNDPAVIVYTSGTTGRPKGVLLTHGNLFAMMSNMVASWEWSHNDAILHVLPLHHLHGLVNALMTPLFVGASCLMLPRFDAKEVWKCLLNHSSDTSDLRVNLFMAVPTIYAKLIEHFEKNLQRGRGSRLSCEYIKSMCMSRIRLMVSGSSALPEPVMEKWESITGHRLLERYGMTEIGMALTNPLAGPRLPGTVGRPFPSVEVCISKPNVYVKNGYDVIATGNAKRTTIYKGQEGEAGELLVKGPSVFSQYWQRPEATVDAFTPDGWFKTGDTVSVNSEGVYKVVGRTSVDVIKSGGYKISALDIEQHLLSHPLISDCAVVGLPDITWGQKVAAVVVLKGSNSYLSQEELKMWAKEVLPPYEVPSVLRCLPDVPRNSMGKVNKKELVANVFPEYLKLH